jgi:uncharacterized protein (DUF4415 family)
MSLDKRSFETEEEEEEFLNGFKFTNPKKNPYAERAKNGAVIIVRDKEGNVVEQYENSRVRIERDLLKFFGGEKTINAVLRQVMELDKMLKPLETQVKA